jgi:hypothetical protein
MIFHSVLTTSSTTYELHPPYAHPKNEVAPRMICDITKKGPAMMIDSQAPVEFWGVAVNTAINLHQ